MRQREILEMRSACRLGLSHPDLMIIQDHRILLLSFFVRFFAFSLLFTIFLVPFTIFRVLVGAGLHVAVRKYTEKNHEGDNNGQCAARSTRGFVCARVLVGLSRGSTVRGSCTLRR